MGAGLSTIQGESRTWSWNFASVAFGCRPDAYVGRRRGTSEPVVAVMDPQDDRGAPVAPTGAPASSSCTITTGTSRRLSIQAHRTALTDVVTLLLADRRVAQRRVDGVPTEPAWSRSSTPGAGPRPLAPRPLLDTVPGLATARLVGHWPGPARGLPLRAVRRRRPAAFKALVGRGPGGHWPMSRRS